MNSDKEKCGPALPGLPPLPDLAAGRLALLTGDGAPALSDLVARYLVSTGEAQEVADSPGDFEPHADTWPSDLDEFMGALDVLDIRILSALRSEDGETAERYAERCAGLARSTVRLFVKLRGYRRELPEGPSRDLADRLLDARAREARAAGYRVELPPHGEFGAVEVWL